jgi:hypothetical protein
LAAAANHQWNSGKIGRSSVPARGMVRCDGGVGNRQARGALLTDDHELHAARAGPVQKKVVVES